MLSLSDCKKLKQKKKVVGRGGKRGGTSGRGHKGQGARSGGSVGVTFEGGQMPLVRRLPKRGFKNERFKKEKVAITVGRLNEIFEDGTEITKKLLIEKKILKCSDKAHLKVIGNSKLEKKFVVHADSFSKSAADIIKKSGGEARTEKEI